jgi:hypothetical protein
LVYVHRVTPYEWDAPLRTSKEGKLVEPHLSTMPHSKVLSVKLDSLMNEINFQDALPHYKGKSLP